MEFRFSPVREDNMIKEHMIYFSLVLVWSMLIVGLFFSHLHDQMRSRTYTSKRTYAIALALTVVISISVFWLFRATHEIQRDCFHIRTANGMDPRTAKEQCYE